MSMQSIKDKARGISYALIRVSFYVKRQGLRDRMENLSFELLESVSRLAASESRENMDKVLEIISVLDGLVRLGHSVYEIEPTNATMLVEQLNNLNEEIRQSGNVFGNLPAGGEQLPHLDETLSVHREQEDSRETEERKSVSAESDLSMADKEKDVVGRVNLGVFSGASTASTNGGNGNAAINAAMRQSAIINKVRNGNGNGIRMKEIVAEFPDVSERTLRYDLQRLCGQGVIERVGNGGPSSYYRAV